MYNLSDLEQYLSVDDSTENDAIKGMGHLFFEKEEPIFLQIKNYFYDSTEE